MLLSDYEKLLAKHDWFYQYSDDSKVYHAGRTSFETLCRQQGILDLDASIWNKHCPADYKLHKTQST